MIKVRKGPRRICQGDIFRDVEYIEYTAEKSGIIEISKILFPHVVVLTQDCDLEQDHLSRWSRTKPHNQDKWLLSVLVAPIYNKEHVLRGEHLDQLGMKMQQMPDSRWFADSLRENKVPRFHYLEFPENVPVVPSVIDFKHYFSVNLKYLLRLKRTNFVCCASALFREDISQRFSSFLARIGLPKVEVSRS